MNGTGELPTPAQSLTQAIQTVINKAVDASPEITSVEAKELGKGMDCLRRIADQQGLIIAPCR